jgi:hypothetical protein
MNIRRPIVAALAIVALALAGCGDDGGGGSDDYASQLTAEMQSLGGDLSTLGAMASSSQSEEELVSTLDQAHQNIQDSIATIQGLEPPSDAQQAQDDLIQALEDFDAAIVRTRDAVDSGDFGAVQQFPADAQTFASDISEVVQEYQDAGVAIRPPSG